MSESSVINVVDHPPHYDLAGMEVIEIIEAMGDGPAFCRAKVIKYLTRYRKKNGLQDLQKARWYLDRLIKMETLNAMLASPPPPPQPPASRETRRAGP